MNTVQPLRDKEQIEEMKTALLKRGYRDYMLFVIGINTGLRVSDILQLKVADVKNQSHIVLTEKKTGKPKRFMINSRLKDSIDKYIQGMNPGEYLFKSRRGTNTPISRVQAYRILNSAASEIGLKEVGTHTMRKSFGYWHYNQYKDVAMLQKLFNHSSPSVTLEYIGINQDMIDLTIEDFSL
jgi:integrase